MRIILFAVLIISLNATTGFGQRTGKVAISAEEQQAISEYEKRLEVGSRLFGRKNRWSTTGEYAGTLAKKHAPDFAIDDWGCTSTVFQVLNKVSDDECLVQPKYKGSEPMLIRGLDMRKVTDGVEFILQHPVVAQETFSYATVVGAKKTVLVLDVSKFDDFFAKRRASEEAARVAAERAKAEAEAAKAETEAAAEEALTRKWSVLGKPKFVAKFITFKNDVVQLKPEDDGKTIEVPMSKLSVKDQDWVREELRRRVLEKQEQQKAQKSSKPKQSF